jgi:flagellar export protein FliJ
MSLKSILQYRRHLEDLAREEVMISTRAIAAQLSAITRLESELQRTIGKIAGSQQETVLADEALALYRFADTLSANISSARRHAEALNIQKEANQRRLLSAAQECRITEKLGARRDRERLVAENRKEQKTNDEGALHRWQALAEAARGGNLLPEQEGNESAPLPSIRRRDDKKPSGGSA